MVLVGQDPYHQPNQATGLCFSVHRAQRVPRSLANILQVRGARVLAREQRSPTTSNSAPQRIPSCASLRPSAPPPLTLLRDARYDCHMPRWGSTAIAAASSRTPHTPCMGQVDRTQDGTHVGALALRGRALWCWLMDALGAV